jgi:hypothetical protein
VRHFSTRISNCHQYLNRFEMFSFVHKTHSTMFQVAVLDLECKFTLFFGNRNLYYLPMYKQSSIYENDAIVVFLRRTNKSHVLLSKFFISCLLNKTIIRLTLLKAYTCLKLSKCFFHCNSRYKYLFFGLLHPFKPVEKDSMFMKLKSTIPW